MTGTCAWLNGVGLVAALAGIAGSVLLAVPFIAHEPDRAAADALEVGRSPKTGPSRTAYERMGGALRRRILAKAGRDRACGLGGCALLLAAFVLTLFQYGVPLVIACTP